MEDSNLFEDIDVTYWNKGSPGCSSVNGSFDSEKHVHGHKRCLNGLQAIKSSAARSKPFGNTSVRPHSTCPQNFSSDKERIDSGKYTHEGGGDVIDSQPAKSSVERPNF